MNAVVFLDCMVLKIRENGSVQRRVCYLALGITLEGERPRSFSSRRDCRGQGAGVRASGRVGQGAVALVER
jgi:hypothetical protein